MRGPAYNMSQHHTLQSPVDNIAAVNPFSDNHGNQSSYGILGIRQGWPQGGQQQWMGPQGLRPPFPGPGYTQRPQADVCHSSGSQYGYHGNHGRMAPRFPQPAGGRQSMYSPQNQESSQHSPGRAPISPIQSQISPGVYKGQGSVTPRSQTSPFSHPQSPEFIATPIHHNGPVSSQQNIGNIATQSADAYQRSQVNQKIQGLINAKRLSHTGIMNQAKSDGYLIKRPVPQIMADRQHMPDPRQPYGASQPLSVMTSLETTSRDNFAQGISCSGITSFSSPALSTCAQRQSAVGTSGHEPKVGQFSNTRGYLLKHLEAQRSAAAASSSHSNFSFNDMKSIPQKSQYARQNSVPVHSSNFSSNYDSPDGAGISARRLSTSALANMQIPKPNFSITTSHINAAMSRNEFLLSASHSDSNAQTDTLSSSLSQHYSQQSLQVCVSTAVSTLACSGSSLELQPKASQIGLSGQYEQISPPVTPMISPNSIKPSTPCTPSPSSNPTHLSPLQKLLLDPMPPSDSVPKARSKGRRKNTDQEKSLPFKSLPDYGAYGQVTASRKGFENSKLYNLLSGEKSKTSTDIPPEKSSNQPLSSASLNDSQQDIFSEIESVHEPSGTLSNQSEMDDSLLSLFSDDFKVRPIGEENELQNSPALGPMQSFDNSSKCSEKGDTGTLSGLQNFVASVRKGSEFGVDFAKHKDQNFEEKPRFVSQMSNSSVSSVDSSLSCSIPGTPKQSSVSSTPQHNPHFQPPAMSPQIPSPRGTGMQSPNSTHHFDHQVSSMSHSFQVPQDPLQMQQQRIQLQQPNSGQQVFSNWSQPSSYAPSMKKPKGEPSKRGRPRLNKSLSVPTNAAGEVVKKKRGRPKKTVEPQSSPQPLHFQGMPIGNPQNQQGFGTINHRRLSMPEPMNSNNSNTHFMGGQKSFQELLEDDPTDFLAELNKDLEEGSLGDMFGNNNQEVSNQITVADFPSNQNLPENSQSCSQQASPFGCVRSFDSSFSDSGQSMPFQNMSFHNSQQHLSQPHYEQQQQQYSNHSVHNQQQQQQCQQYMPSQSFSPQPSYLTNQAETNMAGMLEDSTELNLSQAMNISEPTVNFDTSLDSLFVKDQSPDTEQFDANPNEQSYGSHQRTSFEAQKRGRSLSSGPLERRRFSSNARRIRLNSVSGHSSSSADLSGMMELINYRQKSVPVPSPAYTFRFQIPTPVFKRLKFFMRTSNIERNPKEIVRMHPKDARKYSLLKIGREVVKLVCLTPERIEEIKERITAGETVATMPPAVRTVDVADLKVADSLIAELLSADSPVSEDVKPEDDSLSVQSFPNEHSEIFLGEQPSDSNENVKRQRKNSIHKDKKPKTMFKGNIACVPHLKKYRQGFSYFGKGHVGRGAHIKVRQSHLGLPQELEDDGNIVLKDVSLNDASEGVLTPIKSRTPIAGRSPAYSGGNMSEMEQEKDLLESKLEDLKYDLDLNQSGNSNTFQEALFSDKDVGKDFPETEEQSKSDKDKSDNCASDIQMIKSIKVEIDSDPGTEHELKSSENMVSENVTQVRENKENMDLCVEQKVIKSETFESKDKTNSLKNGITMEYNIESASMTLPKSRKQRMRSRSSSLESNRHFNLGVSRTNSVVGSGDDVTSDSSSMLQGVVRRRHSAENSEPAKCHKRVSSSNSSTTAGSRKGSRSSSCENDSRKKSKSKKKRHRPYRYDSDSDGIPGVDYIVTNRFKGQKELRVVVDKLDEDSIERYSEIAKKMNGFSSEGFGNRASSAESEVRNTCESEGDVKKENDRPFSGFSAEFEKFLAKTCSAPVSSPVMSDSDTEDCDFAKMVHSNNVKQDEFEKGVENVEIEMSLCQTDEAGKSDAKAESKNAENDVENNTQNKVNELKDAKREDSTVVNGEVLSMKMDGVQYKTGECMSIDVCSNSRSCLQCCKNTNVNNSVSSLTGVKDFSSSSEDEEDFQGAKKEPRSFQSVTETKPKAETKKRKMPNKLHDGRAFCTKKSRKKRVRAKPTKLMCTLSVLHDATMEKLSNAQFNSDMDTSSSNQSPCKYQSASDQESPFKPRTKTPDFELYADKSDDYKTEYEDTMYKLAYLSPIPSEKCSLLPPQPLSPQEMTKLDGTTEAVKDEGTKIKAFLNPEVFKTSDSVRAPDLGNERSNDAFTTTSKIAVARTTTLTLQDIKSLCQAELDNDSEDKTTCSPVLEFVNTDTVPSQDTSKTQDQCSSENPAKRHLGMDFSNAFNFFPTVKPTADSRNSSPKISPVVSSKSFFPNLDTVVSLNSSVPSVHPVDSAINSCPALDSATKYKSPLPIVEPFASSSDSCPTLEASVQESKDPPNIEIGSPPPDLGPPVYQSALFQEGSGEFSPPPRLTPNRRISSNSDISAEEDSLWSTKPVELNHKNCTDLSAPPVLVPCRSPNATAGKLSNKQRCARVSDMVASDEFMVVSKVARSKLGRSPGGSITVVHSEEFSDISDENDQDIEGHHDQRSRLKKQIFRQSTDSDEKSRHLHEHDLSRKAADIEREKKLKEIHEFEKRMAKKERQLVKATASQSEHRKTNIFDLLSQDKDNNDSHISQYMEYSGLPKSCQLTNTARRPSEYNSEHFQRGIEYQRLLGNCIKVQERLPNQGLPVYGQANVNIHNISDNHFINNREHKNGEYHRSLSQNDMKSKHNMNGFSGYFSNNGFSQEHFGLNKTFPISRRMSESNGKYPVNNRNFFDHFDMRSQLVNGQVHDRHSTTQTSGDLFDLSATSSRVPSYSRSLSESCRSQYSINHNSKLSESFVKNLKNCMNKDRSSQNLAGKSFESLEYGFGGGRNRSTKQASSQAQGSNSSSSQRSSKSPCNSGSDEAGFKGNGGQQGQGHTQQHGKETSNGCQVITPLSPPPTLESIQGTALQHGLSTIQPLNAFYGNPKDVPEKARYNHQ